MIKCGIHTHRLGKFKDSQFGTDDDVEAMARAFDSPAGAKCMFSNPATPYFVKFGGIHDTDRNYGIINGKLKLGGWVVRTGLKQSSSQA